MINKIKKMKQLESDLLNEIYDKIGYSDKDEFNEIVVLENDKFELIDNILLCESFIEYYNFTISSIYHLNKLLYKIEDDLTYVLCYVEDESLDDTKIIVLKTCNRVDDIYAVIK